MPNAPSCDRRAAKLDCMRISVGFWSAGAVAIVEYEQIWAPWRLGYILGEKNAPEDRPTPDLPPDAEPTCFLCQCGVALRRPPAGGRPSVPAHRHGAEPLPVQQRPPAGRAAKARRAVGTTQPGGAACIGPNHLADGPSLGEGFAAARIQCRIELGTNGGRGAARPSPLAYCSPLDRGHQLHAGGGGDPGDPAVARCPLGGPDAGTGEGLTRTRRLGIDKETTGGLSQFSSDENGTVPFGRTYATAILLSLGHVLQGEPSQAGQPCRCPYCGTKFLVPEFSSVGRADSASQQRVGEVPLPQFQPPPGVAHPVVPRAGEFALPEFHPPPGLAHPAAPMAPVAPMAPMMPVVPPAPRRRGFHFRRGRRSSCRRPGGLPPSTCPPRSRSCPIR